MYQVQTDVIEISVERRQRKNLVGGGGDRRRKQSEDKAVGKKEGAYGGTEGRTNGCTMGWDI